jgi:PBP1b-binding outer membrane lipoprotein LpoB
MLRLISLITVVVFLQGCISTGPMSFDQPKISQHTWDNHKSTALNILEAIDFDDVDEDLELSDAQRQHYDSDSEFLKVGKLIGDTASIAKSVGSLGQLSNLGAIGFGLLKSFEPDDKRILTDLTEFSIHS